MREISIGMLSVTLTALVFAAFSRNRYGQWLINASIFLSLMYSLSEGMGYTVETLVAFGFLFNLQLFLIDQFTELFKTIKTHHQKRKNKPAELLPLPIEIPVNF